MKKRILKQVQRKVGKSSKGIQIIKRDFDGCSVLTVWDTPLHPDDALKYGLGFRLVVSNSEAKTGIDSRRIAQRIIELNHELARGDHFMPDEVCI